MCPATVGAGTAAAMWIAGATAVVSTAVQVHNANKRTDRLEAQAERKQARINDAAQAKENDRLKIARERRATARAAAAQAGAEGNSVDAALNTMLMQTGRDVTRIERNRANGVLDTQQELRGRSAEINGQLIAGATRTIGGAAGSMSSMYSQYSIPSEG